MNALLWFVRPSDLQWLAGALALFIAFSIVFTWLIVDGT